MINPESPEKAGNKIYICLIKKKKIMQANHIEKKV